MIRLYTAPTPNGRKVSIALEELALPYETTWVKLAEGQQNTPQFTKMNPNNKIPVLDDDGQVIYESGAILVHLAEKHGKLLPSARAERDRVLEMVFFQAAHVGPNLGRLGQQINRPAAEQNAEMIKLFFDEAMRVFGVIEAVLADGRKYLAGDYSIADIMTYPWLKAAQDAQAGFVAPFTHIVSWLDCVGRRLAVQRGMVVPE
jgi:GSH-dependent disulfide-bond oxidoreductase